MLNGDISNSTEWVSVIILSIRVVLPLPSGP
jgi:hypothetical protein